MISLNSNTLKLHQGITADEKYIFEPQFDDDSANLHVVKSESDNTYKVAIRYFGLESNRPHWTVELNGHSLKNIDGQELSYFGSIKMVFSNCGDIIRIDETDELNQSSSWLIGKDYIVFPPSDDV